jgi:hypothetical protein
MFSSSRNDLNVMTTPRVCSLASFVNVLQSKMMILAALVASASTFAPAPAFSRSTALYNEGPEIGAGGMADTRNPDAKVDEDPRKSISAAPSFEEYMKQRAAEQ